MRIWQLNWWFFVHFLARGVQGIGGSRGRNRVQCAAGAADSGSAGVPLSKQVRVLNSVLESSNLADPYSHLCRILHKVRRAYLSRLNSNKDLTHLKHFLIDARGGVYFYNMNLLANSAHPFHFIKVMKTIEIKERETALKYFALQVYSTTNYCTKQRYSSWINGIQQKIY